MVLPRFWHALTRPSRQSVGQEVRVRTPGADMTAPDTWLECIRIRERSFSSPRASFGGLYIVELDADALRGGRATRPNDEYHDVA